jgi:hypothetical protein
MIYRQCALGYDKLVFVSENILRPQFWSSQLRRNKVRGWNDMSLAEICRLSTASYQL